MSGFAASGGMAIAPNAPNKITLTVRLNIRALSLNIKTLSKHLSDSSLSDIAKVGQRGGVYNYQKLGFAGRGVVRYGEKRGKHTITQR